MSETASEVAPDGDARAVEVPEELGPVLVLLPDAEARVDLSRPILGRPPGRRLTEGALGAGFRRVLAAPGLAHRPARAVEASVGERIGGPALVAFEGTFLGPDLLALMVEHPLDPDERFTLYDAVGRPAAWFSGELSAVPAIMPLAEELPWPEGIGPPDVARVVYPEDLERAEWLVLRERGIVRDADRSSWSTDVAVPTLRLLSQTRLTPAQLELGALALALGAGLVSLVGAWWALFPAAVLSLLGIHVARLLPAAVRLRDEPAPDPEGEIPVGTLARATRPLAHAGMTAALTYVLVAESDRSQVAGLVLLGAGAVAVFFALAHARSILRGRPSATLDLPEAWSFVARLGVPLPRRLRGAPTLELFIAAFALTGQPVLPWGALVAASLARTWRWFSSPPAAAEPAAPGSGSTR